MSYEDKIKFKDLSWALKVALVYGWFAFSWNIIVFICAFIIVFWGGGF